MTTQGTPTPDIVTPSASAEVEYGYRVVSKFQVLPRFEAAWVGFIATLFKVEGWAA